jgi:hypothetical protein
MRHAYIYVGFYADAKMPHETQNHPHLPACFLKLNVADEDEGHCLLDSSAVRSLAFAVAVVSAFADAHTARVKGDASASTQ